VYVEYRAAVDLTGHVMCTWHSTVGRNPRPILPDGCIDILWIGDALGLAGPDSRPMPVEIAPGTRVTGLRFHPGRATGVLGVPAAELRDARPELAAVWGRAADRLAEQIATAPDDRSRRALLESTVRARLIGAPQIDPVALAVVDGVSDPRRSVADLAAVIGLSERQLHRRCLVAFGYGAKTLDRVLRLQRFLRLARSRPELGLAGLATAAGYSDQAHLSHDCRALAWTTPAALVRRRTSDSDKTPRGRAA
jgi:AraC-like DNA-binding protein